MHANEGGRRGRLHRLSRGGMSAETATEKTIFLESLAQGRPGVVSVIITSGARDAVVRRQVGVTRRRVRSADSIQGRLRLRHTEFKRQQDEKEREKVSSPAG